MKNCPYCAKDIQDLALVCRHCGRRVASLPTAPAPARVGAAAPARPYDGDLAGPGLAAFAVTLVAVVTMFVVPSWIVVVVTALWAAWDSGRVELTSYKGGTAFGVSLTRSSPVTLFLVICLLWILFFPAYLHVRQQIKRGTIPLASVRRTA
jgi:hypothetical protein